MRGLCIRGFTKIKPQMETTTGDTTYAQEIKIWNRRHPMAGIFPFALQTDLCTTEEALAIDGSSCVERCLYLMV